MHFFYYSTRLRKNWAELQYCIDLYQIVFICTQKMHGNKIRLLKNGKKYQTHVFGRMHINMQMSEVSLKFLVGVTFSELELIYTVFFRPTLSYAMTLLFPRSTFTFDEYIIITFIYTDCWVHIFFIVFFNKHIS